MYLLLLIIPVAVPWIARLIWPNKISWKEMGISIGITIVLVTMVYAMGLFNQTSDIEILNGEVLSKNRKHDSYVHSYSCNCRQTCSGSGKNQSCTQTCDTCYEDRYTVKWTCNTNLGNFTIKSLDESSRSVYNTPDPNRYTIIQKGDPVAVEHNFTNYVKAVPDSLFHPNKVLKFQKLIPVYPNNVYDIYKLDRVFDMGVGVPEIKTWNQELSLLLRKLGPQKQANVIVIFVNTSDQSYVHALEGEWIGGKKNDIIVILGSTKYPKIDWVHVSSWTDNSLFKVQLRDDIFSQQTIDKGKILQSIEAHTLKSFKRKEMKDFKYLEEKIQPPGWVLIFAVILSIISSVGLTIFSYKKDF